MTKNAAWIVLIVTTLIVNCAAQKVNIGTPETSIAMQYRQPVGTMNHYQMTNNSTNEIEMMGRSTSSSSSQNAAIMHKIGALKEGKIIHELLYTHIEVDTTNVPMIVKNSNLAKFANRFDKRTITS